ncbi:germin-like protein subfamily 1 member 15 isoform X1 [Cinnamomum micranthum f. kanehirae]|uniref:Germin-like protein subfamily 1 member 15 isoform X1 n=1 Tax=Cinnamomum micranthum f. kanehirae TaxID=337451 RepID=A0A3S3NBB3_9MAGN|nr:germin-like protein subfamily 1 member 15 isoform X1 [Cinnamomum micranthum f. kanehirae]
MGAKGNEGMEEAMRFSSKKLSSCPSLPHLFTPTIPVHYRTFVSPILTQKVTLIICIRLDFAPYGENPPQTHPHATEIVTILEGTLYVGFVLSNQNNNTLITKVLTRVMEFDGVSKILHAAESSKDPRDEKKEKSEQKRERDSQLTTLSPLERGLERAAPAQAGPGSGPGSFSALFLGLFMLVVSPVRQIPIQLPTYSSVGQYISKEICVGIESNFPDSKTIFANAVPLSNAY